MVNSSLKEKIDLERQVLNHLLQYREPNDMMVLAISERLDELIIEYFKEYNPLVETL